MVTNLSARLAALADAHPRLLSRGAGASSITF
jgi:hypothetical protein